MLQLSLVGANTTNFSSPCALFDLARSLGHSQNVSAKLHEVHLKVTLQPQILAHRLDEKTKRQTPCDRKLLYLMQNWEILITARQKHMG